MMEGDYSHGVKLRFVVLKGKGKGLALSFTVIIK